MNFQQAIARSPIRQAMQKGSDGLCTVVSRLESGEYHIAIFVQGQPHLTQSVPDERAVEQLLWDSMRIRSILFEPVLKLVSSPCQESERSLAWWKRLTLSRLFSWMRKR